MTDIESARIERDIAHHRSQVRSVARSGNAELARAYAQGLLALLKVRDPKRVSAEDLDRGII